MPPQRLRVLALHSWRTSSAIFQEQFRRARLDVGLQDLIDMVFVDAPHSNRGPPPADVDGVFSGPYYEWFTTERYPQQAGQELTFTYHGLEESEEFLCRVVREQGPFDGLIGFSQGGVMAAVLAAMQRADLMLTDVPPFKFVLFFGSVSTNHPRHAPAFQEKVQVPSCHVVGHADWVKQHAINLARQFQSPIVIMHPRGHVIPRLTGHHLAVLKAYLAAFMDGASSGESEAGRRRGDSGSSNAVAGGPAGGTGGQIVLSKLRGQLGADNSALMQAARPSADTYTGQQELASMDGLKCGEPPSLALHADGAWCHAQSKL